MMFDPKSYDLRQWTITDAQGKDTTVMIFNVKQGVKFDPALFKIDYKRNQQLNAPAARTRTASAVRLPLRQRVRAVKAAACRGLVISRARCWQGPARSPDRTCSCPFPSRPGTSIPSGCACRSSSACSRERAPDVLCLQETKCPDDLFPFDALPRARLRAHRDPRPEGLSRRRDHLAPAARDRRTAPLLRD